ncbi:uncharacterized protein (DUF2384 family) [Rhizobium sp. BK312]|nr:uncharacterized protein (DUF2384 family) [Rhizobium sp. BK312]
MPKVEHRRKTAQRRRSEDQGMRCATTDRLTGRVEHFESDAEMRAFRKVERAKRGHQLSDGRRRKIFTP